jgi:outer membrane receptor protein involved in Fe transport
MTLDATARYQFRHPGKSLLTGLDLTLAVQNAFDRNPPYVVNTVGYNYDPANASAVGRFIAIQATKHW